MKSSLVNENFQQPIQVTGKKERKKKTDKQTNKPTANELKR